MRADLRLIATKLLAAAAQLRYLRRTLGLVRDAAGKSTMLWLGLVLAQGLVPAAIVYLSRPLVDGLAGAVGSAGEWTRIAPVVFVAAAIGAVILLGELLRSAAALARAAQARLVEDHVNGLIHAKSTQVDLAFYESPEFHDHLHRARDEARYRPIALLENFGGLAQSAVTLLAMAALLAPYGIWISLALLASTLPALVVVLRFAVLQHRLRARTTVDERRGYYYDWLMTSGDAAAEIRVFDLGEQFRAAYRRVRARLRGAELALARSQAFAELAAAALALAIAAACVAWMGWRAMQGAIGLGDLALFYLAFSQGQKLMRSLLADAGQVYYNVLFLGNLFAFLDLEARVADPAEPDPVPSIPDAGVAVRLDGVTFSYPGTERVALRDFSLAVPAGQVAAIVGANGAGKSTVLKLLCRLYDPDTGRVTLGGVDVRQMSLEDVRNLVTVLFQQPVHYNTTVSGNIALEAACARADIEAAARAAGADRVAAALPAGYDTLLGRWFAGGVELSGGEWQRLALARACLRRAPLLVLDEPTSAMDSWAEADWLARLRHTARGRTTIIVTHRFTTAMRADVIHVMDGGRITESGSHAELLERGGAYARSWNAQMRAAQDAREPA